MEWKDTIVVLIIQNAHFHCLFKLYFAPVSSGLLTCWSSIYWLFSFIMKEYIFTHSIIYSIPLSRRHDTHFTFKKVQLMWTCDSFSFCDLIYDIYDHAMHVFNKDVLCIYKGVLFTSWEIPSSRMERKWSYIFRCWHRIQSRNECTVVDDRLPKT